MKKSLLVILFISIFSVFSISHLALAQVSLEVEASKVYLAPGNFTLKITNNLEKNDIFGVTVLGSYRSWVYFDKDYVALYPGKSEIINFNVEPPEKIGAGVYSIPIFIYSLSDENINVQKEIKILIEENYNAEFKSIEINKKLFNPGDTVKTTEKVVNTGTEDFKEINIYYELTRGEKVLNSSEKSFSLGVGEEKLFDQTFNIKNKMPPGDYKIKLYLMKKDRILDKKTIDFSIKEVSKIEKQIDSSWTPIGEFGTINVKNIGNVKKTEKITMEIKKPWDIFLTSSRKSTKEYNDEFVTFIWPVTLEVGKSTQINYQIHYWPLIIVFILVVYAGYWTFKTFRRPKIKKDAVNIKELEDNKKEIMVSLEIKNIGEKLTDVLIEDIIPPVAKLIRDFKTIKPKIKKTGEGTKVIWKLKELDKYEDRILTYKMETLIGTLDYLKLPKAKLKANIGKRKIQASSKPLKIEERE